MDILGIGPLELLFILIIALIIFGPNDLVKAGKTLGRLLRKLVTSDGWQTIQRTSRELRQLPNRLMREAGLEEMQQEIAKDFPTDLPKITPFSVKSEITESIQGELDKVKEELSAWTTPTTTQEESQTTTDTITTQPTETPSTEKE